MPADVHDPGKHCHEVGDFQRVAGGLHRAAGGRGGGFHAEQRGRRHLAPGHPIDAVVDKQEEDVLPPVAGVDCLGCADGGKVSVALVGEHILRRVDPLDGGGHGRGASVCGLLHVYVEVVVGEHRAADGSDADRLLLDIQLLDHLHEHTVDDPVTAARAVMHPGVEQSVRTLVDDFHVRGRVRGTCRFHISWPPSLSGRPVPPFFEAR